MVEPQPEHRVALLEHRVVGGHVRGRARVRLDVRVLGAEERLRPRDRELLDLVDDLAAAVVALAGQALGVLVGEHRADGLEHGGPGEVLGRDQLELVALARELGVAERGDLGIDLGESRGSQVVERVLTWALSGVASGDERECVRRGERPLAQDDGSGGAQVEHGRGAAGRAGPPSTSTAHCSASSAGTSPSVRGSARRAGSPRWRGSRRPRAIAAASAGGNAETRRPMRPRVAAREVEVGAVGVRHEHGRAAPEQRARAPCEAALERRQQRLRIGHAREHAVEGLRRITPLERAQPQARVRLPGVADEPVDGVGRHDGTRPFGERGGEAARGRRAARPGRGAAAHEPGYRCTLCRNSRTAMAARPATNGVWPATLRARPRTVAGLVPVVLRTCPRRCRAVRQAENCRPRHRAAASDRRTRPPSPTDASPRPGRAQTAWLRSMQR